MALFNAYLMVDWSARARPGPVSPSADNIWWCARRGGSTLQPNYCRTRCGAFDELKGLLSEELRAGNSVLIGFDFPFGYPAGFAKAAGIGKNWQSVWQFLARRIEDAPNNANNRFVVANQINESFGSPFPFWGRSKKASLHHLPIGTAGRSFNGRAFAERRLCERRADAANAKTVWQLLGRGSVGSQVLLGLPFVWRLRRAIESAGAVRIWPFETDGTDLPRPVVVIAEIFPSRPRWGMKFATGSIRDSEQVRTLVETLAALDETAELAPLLKPDISAEEWRIARAEEAWILGLA